MKGWQKIIGDIASWLLVIGGIGYALYGYTPGKTITTTTTTPQVKQVQQDQQTAGETVKNVEEIVSNAEATSSDTAGKNSTVKVITTQPLKQTSTVTQQPAGSTAPASAPVEEKKQDTVTVSVKTPDGYLIAPRSVEINDQTKAADVLKQVCQEAGIKLETTGSGVTLYTKGIGGWREFDKGPYSGWSYRINGVKGDRSSGVKDVNPGDTLEWNYVVDYREDK